jgi:membrane-bound ClpP family serine protease
VDLIIPITLILVGLGLIAVEVYVIPGANVAGIAGGLAIVAGVVLAFVEAGALGGILAAVGSLSVGGAMIYLMWQTGALDHVVLAEALARDHEGDRAAEARSRYLGHEGVAVTPLRPAGVVEIDGERVEAQTEGGFIASGSRVRVVAMDRRRFFVRLAELDAERKTEA